jgi:hypothetical protein
MTEAQLARYMEYPGDLKNLGKCHLQSFKRKLMKISVYDTNE